LHTTWNFRLSGGAAEVLAFDLIGQFRRRGSLLIAGSAALLDRLRTTRLTRRRCAWWPATCKLRRSLTFRPRWSRPSRSLLRLRLNRSSRRIELLQRKIPFQTRSARELHFFPCGVKPEHFYFKSPSAVGDAVQLVLTLTVGDRKQRTEKTQNFLLLKKAGVHQRRFRKLRYTCHSY